MEARILGPSQETKTDGRRVLLPPFRVLVRCVGKVYVSVVYFVVAENVEREDKVALLEIGSISEKAA